MKREEAINVIKGARKYLTVGNPIWNVKKVDEAINMAIEALSEGNIARDIATIIENEQDMRVILQNADRPTLGELVRCKDCRRNNDGNLCDIAYYINEDGDGFCNCGERREE